MENTNIWAKQQKNLRNTGWQCLYNPAQCLLKHLYLMCLDISGQFIPIQGHQHFLEELKSVFELLGITQVECVDESQKHGKPKRDAPQVA